VIAFSYDGRLATPELGTALEALLPPDVTIRDLRRAPAGFNPRYAARYREYRYTVWNGPRSPLRERTALGVRVPLDTAAMARAGSVFIGRHDFSAFGATDRSPVRTVNAVRVRRDGRLVTIDVNADSFLRGMVRRMVAVLLEVGHGTLDETAVRAALAGSEPALDGAAAPAKGLCLRRVALGRRPGTGNGEHEER
jgi:tRNA pseudouridine38-40 synthase